jgi:hypothetical protein
VPSGYPYINEFGFFFFLRMAVAVSSAALYSGSVIATSGRRLLMLTSLAAAPDGSLRHCQKLYIAIKKLLVASELTLRDPPWGGCSLAQPTCWRSICGCSECSFSILRGVSESCCGVELGVAVWGECDGEMMEACVEVK